MIYFWAHLSSPWLRLDCYVVDRVDQGNLAETALLAHDYQYVLLDRRLPGLDGERVARLRQFS